ncbi:MAG TPA: hypothetical protein VD861_02350, partial [Pyrinomonadaceae bacterium]|nr:hypothetical protein [Pyrinomonadaceae bacterium]
LRVKSSDLDENRPDFGEKSLNLGEIFSNPRAQNSKIREKSSIFRERSSVVQEQSSIVGEKILYPRATGTDREDIFSNPSPMPCHFDGLRAFSRFETTI